MFDQLPPIIVHRKTRTVIDGVHRLTAAKLLDRTHIDVVFFDGSDVDAFVESVHQNVRHGKPLTIEERRTAALNLVALRPEWSDRLVSETCGISARVVTELRQKAGVAPSPARRVGRDGRRRPVDPAKLRREIAKALRADDSATIRSVAESLGTSPATVSDVRKRLARGEDPVPPGLQPKPPTPDREGGTRPATWIADTACVSTDEGREFASWIEAKRIDDEQWSRHKEAIPVSRIYHVADDARRIADSWRNFAEELEAMMR
jgi:ParB-like chromosome segregation protein Spo0J